MAKNHRRMESANIDLLKNTRIIAEGPPSAQKTDQHASSILSPGVSLDDLPFDTGCNRGTEIIIDEK